MHNGLAFISGCIPFDPKTMSCVEGGIEAQAQRALDNLAAVVKASGSDLGHVLKTTVFLKDMNDFAKVNGVYEKVSVHESYEDARAGTGSWLPDEMLAGVCTKEVPLPLSSLHSQPH